MPSDEANNHEQEADYSHISKLSDLDISTMLNELRMQVTLLEEHDICETTTSNIDQTIPQDKIKKGGNSIA